VGGKVNEIVYCVMTLRFFFPFSFTRTIDAEYVAQRAEAELAAGQYLDAAKNLDGISRELMQASHAQQAFLFSLSLSLSLSLFRALYLWS
jgi:hypothetical protein